MNMYALQLLFRKRNTILLSGEKVANSKFEIMFKKTTEAQADHTVRRLV